MLNKKFCEVNYLLNKYIPNTNKHKDSILAISEDHYLFKYIKNGSEKNTKKLLSVMTFKKYNKHSIIINEGATPSSFYIIIHGSVNIFIKKEKKDLRSINQLLSDSFFERHRDNELFYLKGTKAELIKCVNTLHAGQAFGEKAIIENTTTSATVIAKNEVLLGIIHKSNFNYFFGKKEEKEKIKKINLINSIFLNFTYKRYIMDYLYFFHFIKLKKNEFIFKTNDNFNYIYFIKKGSVILREKLIICDNNKANKILDIMNTYKKSRSNNKIVDYKFRDLYENDVLGIEEFVNNLNKYIFNALVISEKATLLKISKENFIKLSQSITKFKEYFKEYDTIYQRYLSNKKNIIQIWQNNIQNNYKNNNNIKLKRQLSENVNINNVKNNLNNNIKKQKHLLSNRLIRLISQKTMLEEKNPTNKNSKIDEHIKEYSIDDSKNEKSIIKKSNENNNFKNEYIKNFNYLKKNLKKQSDINTNHILKPYNKSLKPKFLIITKGSEGNIKFNYYSNRNTSRDNNFKIKGHKFKSFGNKLELRNFNNEGNFSSKSLTKNAYKFTKSYLNFTKSKYYLTLKSNLINKIL